MGRTTKQARDIVLRAQAPGSTVYDEKKNQVFLTFWDFCLDNLPEGTFSHRCISGEEAATLIAHAREENRLLCVARDDFLAPSHKDEARNYTRLCAALEEHCGIALAARDFTSSFEHEGEPLYTITPLQCVQLEPQDQLLIVTCNYSVSKEKGESLLNPGIATDSITFHLIEAA